MVTVKPNEEIYWYVLKTWDPPNPRIYQDQGCNLPTYRWRVNSPFFSKDEAIARLNTWKGRCDIFSSTKSTWREALEELKSAYRKGEFLPSSEDEKDREWRKEWGEIRRKELMEEGFIGEELEEKMIEEYEYVGW